MVIVIVIIYAISEVPVGALDIIAIATNSYTSLSLSTGFHYVSTWLLFHSRSINVYLTFVWGEILTSCNTTIFAIFGVAICLDIATYLHTSPLSYTSSICCYSTAIPLQ